MSKILIIFIQLLFIACAFSDELVYTKEKPDTIVPGLEYYKIKMTSPIETEFHVLKCDLREPSLEIKPAIGGEYINGSLEKVSSIVKRNNAIAGINANFFGYQFNSSPIGEIKGVSVIDGEFVSTISTESPWLNAGIGITKDRKVITGRPVKYKILISTRKDKGYKNVLVNPLKWEGYDYIIIYTPKIGTIPNTTESPYIILSPVSGGKLLVNNDNLFEITEIKQELPVISKDTYILTGTGEGKMFLANNMKKGDKITISIEFEGIFKNVYQMAGGKIRMVLNGKNRLVKGHPEDGYEERMSAGRLDDKTLILCCGTSTCFTMAELLVDLGIEDAVMLDGGGSATMVIKENTVYGGEREVADALLIFTRPN